HVRVDGQARGVEGVAQNDVRGLASDAGALDESVHSVGNHSVERLDEVIGELGDIAGPGSLEAGGEGEYLCLEEIGRGQAVGVGEVGEQAGRDRVDADIGRLCR